MKSIIIFSMLALSGIHSISSAQGWEWQNPLPTGFQYTDAVLFDQNEILISCFVSSLVRSLDGGKTWNIEHTAGDSVIVVKMEKSGGILYAKAMMPKSMQLEYSVNRGKTFATVKGYAGDSTSILDFQVLAPHVLLVISGTRYNKFLSRTTDDGITWTDFLCPANSPFNQSSFQYGGLAFRDSLNGIIPGARTGPAMVYRTTDGGKNWMQSLPIPYLNDAQMKPLLWSNDTTLFVYCSKTSALYLYRSTDTGYTWDAVASMNGGIGDMYVVPVSGRLLTVDEGPGDRVRGSIDGGTTWSLLNENLKVSMNGLSAISFLDDKLGLVVGAGGKIFKTTDGGITWDKTEKGFHATWSDIYFLNKDTGIAVGLNEDHGDDGGAVARTTNGGINWDFTTLPIGSISRIDFTDNNHGWLGGDVVTTGYSNPLIMKTSDGGISWIPAYNWPGLDSNCYSVYDLSFTSKDEGWAAANNFLLYTSDGGNNWIDRYKSLPVSANSSVYQVIFRDASHGWIRGTTRVVQGMDHFTTTYILETNDTGASWDTVLTKVEHVDSKGIPAGYRIERIIYRKPDLAWILTSGGVSDSLYRSNDGGKQWLVTAVPFSVGTGSTLFFLDDKFGWAGDFTTSDAGANWTEHHGFTPLRNVGVTKSFFISPDEGWVVGNGSAILHTTTGGVNAVRSVGHASDKNFQLSQNYPNPAIGMTNIELRISNNEHQKAVLKVYNIFGREIATLANEQLEAGNYSITFNTSSLPAGVYYYRLVIGDQVTTKKMIVIK